MNDDLFRTVSTAPPGRTGARARKYPRCDNCGTLTPPRDWEASTWVSGGAVTYLCGPCTADYRLVESKICVRKWVASNNPPGDPEP